MNRARLEALLREVSAGALTPEAALQRLTHFPTEELGFARLDHHRLLRQGQPEVVFAEGKTVEQVVAICERLEAAHGSFLATRVGEAHAGALRVRFPGVEWNALGRTAWLPAGAREALGGGELLVVTAGTSDLPVAEEAAAVAHAMGACVTRLADVGVAGLHRLLDQSELLERAAVIASFGGIAALLGMLNSCAAGVTVVNIDNGFGAAMAAVRLLAARARALGSGE